LQLLQNKFSVTKEPVDHLHRLMNRQKCIPHKQRIGLFKKKGQPKLPFYVKILLFDDLQDLHGASLDADAAGDALGGRILRLQHHDLHGAGLDALAAADALLLVDHVDAGLGILGNSLMLTGLHALAALDADHGIGSIALSGDLDAGQIGVELLVECLGASLNALQAGHTFGIFLNSQLFHNGGFSFLSILQLYYTASPKK
jgi:hypothetical protein